MSGSRLPFASLRLFVFPYLSHTVVTAVMRSTAGAESWDRRVESWDLPVPASDLRGVPTTEALATVLREVLNRLDPPEGATWAEPSASPGGGPQGAE